MKSEDVRRPAKVEVLLFHSGADTIPTLLFSSLARGLRSRNPTIVYKYIKALLHK